MKHLIIKSSLMMGFVLASHMSFAENIEVTPIQQVTSQELAAIYVLSEVCEKFITDEVKFEAGYRKLVQEYLPTERDAVTTLKKMSLEQSFQAILLEAKNDAIAAGDTKNQEICLELSAYSN